ncbi:MAG: thiamine diphosphokinase [Bacteroidia bacterium]|nr:thiamine diphosphokinase [Bacteroidia bacterium]NNJ56691.1 thiamine diphosphokinase [Bacteroidia bacterium]
MSSHHFVKEGQEPALIIANGASCSYELLTEIMEWSPLLVVLDGAYQRVKELGIKPDVVIGDFDSITDTNDDIDVEFIHLTDQESTDLEKGIEYLISRDFRDINVLWATGKRVDHTMNNIASLAKFSEYRIVLYDDFNRVFVLPQKYSKHYPKNFALSLIPLGKVTNINTKNLRYNLQNEDLEIGIRSGTSNHVLETGIVKISYEQGQLVLVENRSEV